MTEHPPLNDETNRAPTALSVTDPASLADEEDVDVDRRTYRHDDLDHCETDAAGRAVVGITSDDGTCLLLVHPGEGHAVLPNETVAPGEDWAVVGRRLVDGYAGLDVHLDRVVRVREVTHLIEGEREPRSTTHHVVFEATPAADDVADGLCDDNDWELGWYEELPAAVDDDETGALDDIRLFVG